MSRTPGTTIRVQAPQPEHGMPTGRLFISRGLYTAIGCPARVMLLAHGARVLIQAGDEYTVVVPKAGQPRVSLGEYARELLALDAGTYAATVNGTRIVVQRGEAPVAVSTLRPARTRGAQGSATSGRDELERHRVTLPASVVERLSTFGHGNLSDGIRAAVEMLDGG